MLWSVNGTAKCIPVILFLPVYFFLISSWLGQDFYIITRPKSYFPYLPYLPLWAYFPGRNISANSTGKYRGWNLPLNLVEKSCPLGFLLLLFLFYAVWIVCHGSIPIWCLGQDVAFDCFGSWSLHIHLLSWPYLDICLDLEHFYCENWANILTNDTKFTHLSYIPYKILEKYIYEGHFRSNVNVIFLTYSMLFTSKAVYHRKRQP